MFKERVKKVLKIFLASFLLVFNMIPNMVTAKESIEGKLSIVTSCYPVHAITQEIVDGIHEIQMISSNNGVHGFEPSAQDVADIYDSDIFIYHSVNLESWTKNIKRNLDGHDVKIVEAADGLEMDRVPGLEDFEVIEGMDEESVLDPHTWLDPVEAANEAQLIANALSEIDPKNQDHYQKNADEFTKTARDMVERYTPIFDSCQQKTFVTQHTAFSYLAKRFGLTQLGISGISNDVEPAAQELIEVQDFCQKNNVKTIFIEPNVNPSAANIIADATGAEIVMLTPLEVVPDNDLTYLENLEEVLETLSQALKAEENR